MIQMSTVYNCLHDVMIISSLLYCRWFKSLERLFATLYYVINAWYYVLDASLVFGLCFICWDAGGCEPFHSRSILMNGICTFAVWVSSFISSVFWWGLPGSRLSEYEALVTEAKLSLFFGVRFRNSLFHFAQVVFYLRIFSRKLLWWWTRQLAVAPCDWSGHIRCRMLNFE